MKEQLLKLQQTNHVHSINKKLAINLKCNVLNDSECVNGEQFDKTELAILLNKLDYVVDNFGDNKQFWMMAMSLSIKGITGDHQININKTTVNALHKYALSYNRTCEKYGIEPYSEIIDYVVDFDDEKIKKLVDRMEVLSDIFSGANDLEIVKKLANIYNKKFIAISIPINNSKLIINFNSNSYKRGIAYRNVITKAEGEVFGLSKDNANIMFALLIKADLVDQCAKLLEEVILMSS